MRALSWLNGGPPRGVSCVRAGERIPIVSHVVGTVMGWWAPRHTHSQHSCGHELADLCGHEFLWTRICGLWSGWSRSPPRHAQLKHFCGASLQPLYEMLQIRHGVVGPTSVPTLQPAAARPTAERGGPRGGRLEHGEGGGQPPHG